MHLPLRYPFLALTLGSALALSGGLSSVAGDEVHQTVCLSRMRELATAIRLYAADHNDELPLVANRTKHPWRWWYNEIFAYTPTITSFYCPQLQDDRKALSRSPLLPVTWDLSLLSYGMTHSTDSYQREHGKLRFSDITDAEEKIMLAESNFAIFRPTRQYWAEDLAPRHAGAANFVTFSGAAFHVGNLPGRVPSQLGKGIHHQSKWTLP